MKINFNAKNCKEFRNLMNNYYNAIHSINDIKLQKEKSRKAVLSIMETDRQTIESMLDGTYNGIQSIIDVRRDLKDMQSRLDTINEEIGKLTTDYNKAVKAVHEHVYTDEMYNAAKNVVASYGDSDAVNEWRNTVLAMFKANNVCDHRVTAYDVREYDYLITVKENNGKMMKNKGALGISKKDKQASIFCRGLVEYMVEKNYLHPYKYVFKDDKKKK